MRGLVHHNTRAGAARRVTHALLAGQPARALCMRLAIVAATLPGLYLAGCVFLAMEPLP